MSINSKASGGFSLIELMIVIGLMGLVTAGTALLMQNMMTSSSRSEASFAKIGLASDLRHQVGVKEACLVNLAKAPSNFADPSPTREIQVRLNSNEVAQPGHALPSYSNLHVQDIVLNNWRPLLTMGTKNYYTAMLDLTVASKNLTASPVDSRFYMKPVHVAQMIFEVEANSLVSCFASDANFDIQYSLSQTCTMLGGTLDENNVCQMDPAGGLPCSTKGLWTNGTYSVAGMLCTKTYNSPRTPAQVPAAEQEDYNWMCPGLGKFGSYGPLNKNPALPYGGWWGDFKRQLPRSDCWATTKYLPVTASDDFKLESGAFCSVPSWAGAKWNPSISCNNGALGAPDYIEWPIDQRSTSEGG